MSDLSDEDLLAALGETFEEKEDRLHTPEEERIIAGFEDILAFVEKMGHAPKQDDAADIFERLYAVRLARLRENPDWVRLLAPLDSAGLLVGAGDEMPDAPEDDLDDEALLAELGVETNPDNDITVLKHVRDPKERESPDEVATTRPCANFPAFEPLFKQVLKDLDAGIRETRPFGKDASVSVGEYFIVRGQIAYVAAIIEEFRAPNGEWDGRLRVIYDNGSESNLLKRSLQRALHGDEAGRRITDPTAGPLFGTVVQESDTETGTIYVLRSLSDHPFISAHRDLVHKIGVTGGDVKARTANARKDPTFLFADVDIVATYKLYNINRSRLENLLHRFFADARIDLDMSDRFGSLFKPREWFLVPLSVIDKVVAHVQDGTLPLYAYDPQTASLTSR